jgi:ribosomal-protein-alanine N-acetyltransferase
MQHIDSESDSTTGPSHTGVRVTTKRTIVRTAEQDDADAVLRFYTENRERLRPFDPERAPIFYEERFWRMQIQRNVDDLAADRALRLFIFAAEDPGRVIGNISFSNFVRGIGQYCTLGYSIGGEDEGKGLMSEALRAAMRHAFQTLNFHRIEANYMPHNVRSGQLLRRLGFAVEGYSRDYLFINGRWEDHVRAAIINPDWHR